MSFLLYVPLGFPYESTTPKNQAPIDVFQGILDLSVDCLLREGPIPFGGLPSIFRDYVEDEISLKYLLFLPTDIREI